MERGSALLVIDMLNDFVQAGAVLEIPGAREIIPAIKAKIEEARKEVIPIIYICDSHAKDDPEFKEWPPHAVEGTKGAEIVEELRPRSEDHIVAKRRYSGFFETSLDLLLKELKVDKIILTGTVTDICVYHTAADAYMRGYKVVIPKGCVAALNPEDQSRALRQMERLFKAEIV